MGKPRPRSSRPTIGPLGSGHRAPPLRFKWQPRVVPWTGTLCPGEENWMKAVAGYDGRRSGRWERGNGNDVFPRTYLAPRVRYARLRCNGATYSVLLEKSTCKGRLPARSCEGTSWGENHGIRFRVYTQLE